MNPQTRMEILTLLQQGVSQHKIAKRLGVARKTVRSISHESAEGAESDGAAVKLPPQCVSQCEPHRAFIEAQLLSGRNAQGIFEALTDENGYLGEYDSVKRFVRKLKKIEPERFDFLEFLPGEEAQVDYGLGAPILTPDGKRKKTYLFVMVLKYSGKAFRKTTTKTSQEIWAQLHEEAFRYFGGAPRYVVLDNLKEGVIKPSIYDPKLNPLYARVLAHYGCVADPCKVRDPNRKGSVENGVKHTQNTPLKGKTFESVDKQNAYLADWSLRWADTRVHGTKKRVVNDMFEEEKPHLRPLPAESFRYYSEETRIVRGDNAVEVKRSYYSALPAKVGEAVLVRIYQTYFEILTQDGVFRRRHDLSDKPGSYHFEESERLFNPTRNTAHFLDRLTLIGPTTRALGNELLKSGRQGERLIRGIAALLRRFKGADIEALISERFQGGTLSLERLVEALKQRETAQPAAPALRQTGDGVRSIDDYREHFDQLSEGGKKEKGK